jgi:hypothetical protein
VIDRRELLATAGSLGLLPNVVEKDYVLGWTLAGVYNHPELADKWVFKGGTCLKKCYFETYRFSEDLDFTTDGRVPVGFHRNRPQMVTMTTTVAIDPYSSNRIQPGTRQSCRNGTSQSRYHGYMTGAPASDTAIGQAHASDESAGCLPRNHTAVTRPNKTDTPAAA